jgi:hypothetical protein
MGAPATACPGRARLRLIQLTCTRTEDWTGADESKLVLYSGILPLWTDTRDLNDGESWTINLQWPFTAESNLKIELWDEDWPDGDDFLGDGLIPAAVNPAGSMSFTLDGANYTLACAVDRII